MINSLIISQCKMLKLSLGILVVLVVSCELYIRLWWKSCLNFNNVNYGNQVNPGQPGNVIDYECACMKQ